MRAFYKKSKSQHSTPQDIQRFKQAWAQYQASVGKARREATENFCKSETNAFGKSKQMAFAKYLDSTLEIFPGMLGFEGSSRFDILKHLTATLFGPSKQEHSINPTECTNKEPDFKYMEVRRAIFSFNANKAPRPDGVDHFMLRELFHRLPHTFLNIYNTLLSLNYFPQAWKLGKLVYFKKDGKPSNIEKSYRLITLLPVLGKVFEKIILTRIHHSILISNSLSGKQHGFLPGKSTETALTHVLSLIDLNKMNSKYTSLISIDFESAFDNLPWEKSIRVLSNLTIPHSFISILSSFLSDRSAQVDWQNPSYIHHFFKGCPQGSCLGPFLWLAILETLLSQDLSCGSSLVAYAEDLLLIVSSESR